MTIRSEIESIERRIAYADEMISKHTENRSALQALKATYFREGSELPLCLMSETERAKVLKMPFTDDPCEFCGKMGVKQGRKKVCIECGHEQS